MSYDKMYYTVFNAVTDALEVAEKMPDSPEKKELLCILSQSQQISEDIYVSEA